MDDVCLVENSGAFETGACDIEIKFPGKLYGNPSKLLNFLNANPSIENSGNSWSKTARNRNSGGEVVKNFQYIS